MEKEKFLSELATCKSEVSGWDWGVRWRINRGWAEGAHLEAWTHQGIKATWLAQTGGRGKTGKAPDISTCWKGTH